MAGVLVIDHNAAGTRVTTRPVWVTFLLMLVTGGLYRTYWAWRANEDLGAFARARDGVVDAREAIRVNPSTSAFATFLLLPGSLLVLVAMLYSLGSVPSEYRINEPSTTELARLLGIGVACLVPGLVATLRTADRIRRARTLAGLEPTTLGTGRAFVPMLLLEIVAVPASLFALQHSLNDLWSRFPPLLDEDLHGELAPPDLRDAAIARRPLLHQERLARIADELERPTLVPWVSIAFGALCALLFGWQLWEHGPFPDTSDIERVGGLREGLDGMWWRFWSANVLHGSVEHLAGNLLVWAVVATMVERVVGHARMLVLVLAGAAGCSVGALIAHGDIVSVGASGVVFAAFGLAAMVDPLARRAVGRLGWSLVAIGLGLSTFAPGISSGGHIGGLLAGLAVGAVVALIWRIRRPSLTETDRRAARRPPIDRAAPLAPARELSVAERLTHLERQLVSGELAPGEHERLRHALLTRG